jgi:hypothetical protein
MQLLSFDQVQKIVNVFSPTAGSPGSPLETTQWLRSLQPSLMPRTSLHQGAASGVVILAARAASNRVDYAANKLTPNQDSLTQRIAVRAALVGAGYGLRKLPDPDDTAARRARRLTGELVEGGAAGGVIYEVMAAARGRGSSTRRGAELTMAGTLAAFGFALYKSRKFLQERQDFFTDDFDKLSLNLHKTIAVTAGITAVGTGMGVGHKATRRGLEHFFGPGLVHTAIARTVNNAAWAAGLTGLYWAGISKVGQANEKIDPGYAQPPTSPLVSGSADSLCPFEELGQQGRRYVTDVITPELIESAMGEPAVAHPIRVFVGFNQQPLYTSGRAETALEEMERTGAYDRGTILLVSPTGTGWVDHTMIEAAEFLLRGDVATVCIQYGRYPSFLSLQKVRAGRRQFRNLVWGVRQRIRSMPEDQRPRVLVFGESLGAWASSDVIMKLGIEGLDHYGVERALWFGMPQLARWSAAGLIPPRPAHPRGHRGCLRPLGGARAAVARGARPAAHRAAQPRQRPHHPDDAHPALPGAGLARRATGPQRPRGTALVPHRDRGADDDRRRQRDAQQPRRVPQHRPRLPRRHGSLRRRGLPAAVHRGAAGQGRSGPSPARGRARGPHQAAAGRRRGDAGTCPAHRAPPARSAPAEAARPPHEGRQLGR